MTETQAKKLDHEAKVKTAWWSRKSSESWKPSTPMTETQAKKLDHEAKVKTAWASLALSPEFQTVFTDLQIRFGFLEASFTAQNNYNPTAAAVRDGEKNVLRHIAKKLSFGLAVSEDDNAPEKQREAL